MLGHILCPFLELDVPCINRAPFFGKPIFRFWGVTCSAWYVLYTSNFSKKVLVSGSR